MRNLVTVLITLVSTFFINQNGHATYDPTWERPISKASMRVERGDGWLKYMHDFHITANHRDGAERPGFSSFKVDFMTPTPEGEDARTTVYFSTRTVTRDECGGIHYLALSDNPGIRVNDMPMLRLKLIDHSKNICEEIGYSPWDATLESTRYESNLTLYSNTVEPIMTILNR